MTPPSNPHESTVKPSKVATKMVSKRPSTSQLENDFSKRMRAAATSSILDISVIGCPPSPQRLTLVSFGDYTLKTEAIVTPTGRESRIARHYGRATSPSSANPTSIGIKKKLGPSDFVEMVYLDVGPAEKVQRFSVHKGPLCFYSKTFRRAFEGTFKEAQEGVMKMPEDDTEVVKIFVGWVYSQKLFDDNDGDNQVPLSIDLLCKLYFFAEMRDIPALCNAIIDTLLTKIDEDNFLSPRVVPTVYANTSPTSPLRKVCVDYLVHGPEPAEARYWLLHDRPGHAALPTQFLVDFSLACHQLLGSDVRYATKNQIKYSVCHYHQHEEGEKCEQKSRA